jgi:glycosyltransferase involved in cell wall biosynthesis
MAAACLELLADPGRRAAMGAAARERALELFTVEQAVDSFREIYGELGAARQSAGAA